MTYNADLSRKGPGLLVRDLERFDDAKLKRTVSLIVDLAPDVLALQSIDFDHGLVALGLLQERLKEAGHEMPHHFAVAPNSGISTGFDLDRDGRLDTARDRQGYGLFAGQGGMAVLSTLPIDAEASVDHSALLWRDLEGATLPPDYFKEQELSTLRLHSVGAWDVAIRTPDGVVRVLVTQTAPPVFDGPEDRNGLRNSDQIKFWVNHIDNIASQDFVLVGGLNNDPVDGEGLKPELSRLLAHRSVQDVAPSTSFGLVDDADHRGRPEQDTVDWGRDIGSLRVDYVLPSASLDVAAAAVERDQSAGEAGDITAHKPVWVDVFWK